MPAVTALDVGALLRPLVLFISFGALLLLRSINERVVVDHLLLLPGCNRLAVRPDHRHRLLRLHGLTVGPDHHLLLRLHHLLLRLHRRTVGPDHHHHRLLGLVRCVDALTHARIHHHLWRNMTIERLVHHHGRLALRRHRLHYYRLTFSNATHLHVLLRHIHWNNLFNLYYY